MAEEGMLGGQRGVLAHRQQGGVHKATLGPNPRSHITVCWLHELTSLCLNFLCYEMGTSYTHLIGLLKSCPVSYSK